ncbi:hypothetical protein TNCV_887601 [Trichonephila clavipes]|uniref:Uncharacterized protein n=1 Tax=Trichonephila clavipes TaxID=2585209 RepID=A0A8X6V098_TRICX|nr:hypothetical protein TNCV_887601 [Trichonephila clavipes]
MLIAPPISQSYAQATKSSKVSATTQTDENIKIKCPPLKLLQQPPSLPKPNISPYIPSTSTSSAQADLLTSTSPIADISESEPVNPIPNNVPSTSNISAFPSNSGVQPTSASTSIQVTKLKAKTRARKRGKKKLLKKINDAIIEIKMAPHKPRKSTPEQDSEDEDMIEYNPDEFDPDDYVQKYYTIGEYKSVITPTCYKNPELALAPKNPKLTHSPTTSNNLSTTSAFFSSNKTLSSSDVSMFTPLPAETCPAVETETSITNTIPFTSQDAKQTLKSRKKRRPK